MRKLQKKVLFPKFFPGPFCGFIELSGVFDLIEINSELGWTIHLDVMIPFGIEQDRMIRVRIMDHAGILPDELETAFQNHKETAFSFWSHVFTEDLAGHGSVCEDGS